MAIALRDSTDPFGMRADGLECCAGEIRSPSARTAKRGRGFGRGACNLAAMSALARLRAWIARSAAGRRPPRIRSPRRCSGSSLVYGATALVSLVAIELAFRRSGLARSTPRVGCLALLAVALFAGPPRARARRRSRAGGDAAGSRSCSRSAMTDGVSLSAQSGFVLAICSAGLLLGRARGLRGRGAVGRWSGPIFGGLHLRTRPAVDSPTSAPAGLWLMQAAIFASTAALVSITVMLRAALARARAAQRAALPRARRQHPGRHHRVRRAGPLRLREPGVPEAPRA